MKFQAKALLVLTCIVTLSACSSRSARDLISFTPDKNYQDMYLRGIFSWWEATEQFKLQRIDDYTYSLTIELIADGQPYDFKVADGSWTPEFNCGFEYAPEQIELNDDVELVCEETSQNIQFVPAETGFFEFTFDISDNDEPELSVRRVEV
jgi:hypothetical protein